MVALLAFAALCVGFTSLNDFLWTDYDHEALVPVGHLLHGELTAFAQTAPAYGGSLLLRAPFALVAHWLGGGEMAVYRALAVPCLLAAMALGLVLWRARRERLPGEPARWAVTIALLAAANPVTLRALEIGHPEDLLGAVLCTGAVLAALWRRPWLASVLLGLALANKAWAVLAVGPVLVALPARRVAVLAGAGAIAAAVMAPILLSPHATSSVASGATDTGIVFQPWQAWWFLGEHGHRVVGFLGMEKVGYRTPPAWLGPITHPLIAALVVPCTLLWLRVRDRRREDALLLLALLMLLRCALDPFDIGYYHLPFLLALLGWETLTSDRPPVLSLTAAVVVWFTFEQVPQHLPADGQALSYLAWAVPLVVVIARRLYRAPAPAAVPRGAPVPAAA